MTNMRYDVDVDFDVDVSVRWQPRLLEEAGGGEKGRGGVENTFLTWLLNSWLEFFVENSKSKEIDIVGLIFGTT